MKYIATFIAALALTFNAASAQEASPWSIEQCIDYALGNNIQVKQSLSDIETSRLNRQQSKMAYLPSLNASAGHSLNSGRSLDPTTYEFVNNQTVNNVNSSVNLSTTLFAGMQKMHQLHKSELNLQMAIQSSEQLKNEITIAVTGSYLQLLYEKERVSNQLAQIESIQEQVSRTAILVEAGSQPQGALLELEAQLASEQYSLVSARNSQQSAILSLKQLLELQPSDSFDVMDLRVDTLPEAFDRSVDGVFDQAQVLPQIEISKLQSQVAQRDISLAKARMYPTLNFGMSYGSSWSDARERPLLDGDGTVHYGDYPFFDQMGDNASFAMQLSMSVPIFNGLNAQRGIQMAKVAERRAALGENLAQNQLLKDIQQAYNDADGALQKYYSAQSSLKSAQKSFEYAQQKFTAGASTSVDYTTAKNNLIVAESTLTQAKYEFLLRSKILDFYAGVPITL